MKQLVRIASDSIYIEGVLEIPDMAKGMILFAHGSGSSRLSPRNNYVARELRNAGLGTLLMDLLTPSEDQDYQRRFDIQLLMRRLLDCVIWLRDNEATRGMPIGLFGASTGAAAALLVAAELGDDIAAVVSRGGRPDMAGMVLTSVKSPTLLMVGGSDSIVIELNQRAFEALHCEKRLEVIPGATHLFEEPGKLERVAALASDWFVQHMAPSHQASPGMARQKPLQGAQERPH